VKSPYIAPEKLKNPMILYSGAAVPGVNLKEIQV
jgi:hypothetical protein